MLGISKKTAIIFIIVAVVLLVLFFAFRGDKTTVISQSTVIEGDYTVPKGTTLVLENSAILEIGGGFDVEGNIVADGDLNIVALGSVNVSEDSEVVYGGNIQIVDSAKKLLRTEEEISKAFEEAGLVSEDSNSFGPFNKDNEGDLERVMNSKNQARDVGKSVIGSVFARTVKAQVSDSEVAISKNQFESENIFELKGKWIPAFGEKSEDADRRGGRIVYVNADSGKTRIVFRDFELKTWSGKDGKDDKYRKCKAVGENGEPGSRTIISAWQVIFEDGVVINLAGGGKGGDAETKNEEKNPKIINDCALAEAYGGDGGEPGNLKITSEEGIYVNGSLTINPGKGGNGGGAKALGSDSWEGEKGGDAKAYGGDGADNEAVLFVRGDVNMTFNGAYPNLVIGNIVAGNGGDASAIGGLGANGEKCEEDGFLGGDAVAYAGDGGIAVAPNNDLDKDIDNERGIYKGVYGGYGGDADSVGGDGGDGANRSSCPGGIGRGGDGGDGGDAESESGEGGLAVGISALALKGGDDGKEESAGGDGGDGGDGCFDSADGGLGGEGKGWGLPGEDGEYFPDCGTPVEKEDINVINEDTGNVPDDFSGISECSVPDSVINQAYPSDVYTKKESNKNGKRVLTFSRGACVSKTEASVRRGAEAFLPDLQEYCPNATVSDVSFSGMMQPCSFSITLD